MMAFGAMIVGCERHEFEGEHGTRQLHEKSTPGVAQDDEEESAPEEDD